MNGLRRTLKWGRFAVKPFDAAGAALRIVALAGAFGFVAAAAEAADLPLKGAAPPPQGLATCSVAGMIGFVSPGTDICVKLSGYVASSDVHGGAFSPIRALFHRDARFEPGFLVDVDPHRHARFPLGSPRAANSLSTCDRIRHTDWCAAMPSFWRPTRRGSIGVHRTACEPGFCAVRGFDRGPHRLLILVSRRRRDMVRFLLAGSHLRQSARRYRLHRDSRHPALPPPFRSKIRPARW